LFDQFTGVIGRMKSALAEEYLNEFLGREEKIMLAKRLAIIALVHEGRPLHRIATYLHVSESTVAKIHERYKKDHFTATIQALTGNKVDYKKFIQLLDTILTVGGIMPHRNYILKPQNNRW
jgi:uncharacterized protein YerC